jgi:hypothetical protein
MNEQREKKEWISPEIIDLDVMETASTTKEIPNPSEGGDYTSS